MKIIETSLILTLFDEFFWKQCYQRGQLSIRQKLFKNAKIWILDLNETFFGDFQTLSKYAHSIQLEKVKREKKNWVDVKVFPYPTCDKVLKKFPLVLSILLGIGVVTKRSIVKWKRQVVGQASSWERACSKPVNSYLQSTHKSIIRPKAAAKNGPTKKGQDWKWLYFASKASLTFPWTIFTGNFGIFNHFLSNWQLTYLVTLLDRKPQFSKNLGK